MPLTAEERAARRESRRSNREKERRASNSARHNLQGYQTESARLFGLSVQSSNDSSNLVNSSNDSTNLVNSLNDSTNHLDSSYNSATKRRPIHRNLSGIEEGLDCSAAESKNSRNSMQPPGQDAAQGGSPRHNRVGPFEKDTDDDDYYDDQEETGGGSNNNGGVSTNPFLDDSTDGDGASSPEREFQPAKLDRSATSAKSSGRGGGGTNNGEESFDTDDDPPSNSRPATFAASALTTSSSATQRVNNTDGEGNNRKTARDKFMEVMQDDDDDDNREETTEDYGSAFNNDAGPSPFDDDSVDQASQGSYEQPRAYRPFSGGSQTSAGSGGGEHYASMQELLEEERSRSFVGHKTSRFGGCVETCLGGKKTKRRKITLAVIGLVIGAVIGVCVYSIVLGNDKDDGGGGKKEGVEKQLQQQIERPGTNFVPGNTGNASKPDSTFGMADNSTDDIFDIEPTFPDGSTAFGGDNATADSSSPTASPVSTSTIAPTPPVSEIIPGEFKATSPPSGSPTPPLPEFIPAETNQPTGSPAETTVQPTGSPAAAETTFQPTVSPSAAKTTLQPTGSPSAAPFVSISTVMSDSPVTVAPVLSPTNPPIAASVPSVQTDISGLLTFSEPVPQDTESNLIAFLDALKKSIRSAVSSSLQANDELVYVEIVSINGEAVDSLLLRRRFIRRRRLQFGSLVVYEIVVLTDCDLSDCTDADTVADDVFTRTTNEISSSVFSGEFASTLEVNVLSSSGGSVDYFTGVELGDFSEPKVTVLTPAVDLGANETSSTNSTAPADVIATNETDPIDSSATGDDTTTANTCEFCKDGMPDPFKVVSDSGLTCNQLIEAISDKDKDSSTCVTVKQAEGLCCEVSSTVSDTIDETPATNTTIGGNETFSTNSTEGDLGDSNATESPSLNSTLVGNETILTNITSGGNLSDVNETTMTTNSTPADFVIDTIVVGNETFVSYGDMPIIDENGTDSGFVDDALYPDLLCPVTLTRSIKIDEFASLFYEVVPSSSFEARNGIFCARLQVKSLGWIGFALSRDGSMVGSDAIIALPDDGTVLKYSLLGKSPDLISKVDDEHQTLRGTSVTQDLELGVTTMAFVKHLDEFEEIPILEKGANHFLYARGGINVLGYHLGRTHFMKDFAEDVVAVVVDDDVSIDLGDGNATISSNSTGSEDIYVIDTVVVGNETFVTYDDTPIYDLNKPEPFYNTTVAGNETIMTTNSTSEDFVIDTVVIGNETFVSFGDMPTIDANGTDSGFDMDVLYPDVNSTEDDSNETATPNDVVTISNETLYSVDDASGTAVNATDFADPAAILDALSLPYTLSHEIEGVSAAARYGFSVAMSSDGNIIAVGAKDMTDVVLGEVGAVHLYSMETSPPSLLQTLVNEYPNGEFGNSIGLSNDGSRLVVGARSENDQTGVVRVYGRDSVGQFALFGMPINGLSSGERAGWSVSISGDGSSVAVGAPKGGGSSSGSVVTYRFEDGLNWAPYGSALEGVSKEAFGCTTSLSYDGNLVAVGSPKAMNPDAASNAGKASVFYMFGTEWLPLPAKEIHGISSNDIDGTSIALSQDGAIMVVGGKGRDNDDGVKNVGHCRIYEFGTDWDLLHSMEGQSQNERLGSSVAVSKNGNVVACGGETAMYDGVGIGVVRVWNRETSQSSAVWPRTSDGGALFGSALSLKEDGKILAVGAPERNSMTVGSKAGAVDVYRDFI